MFTCLHTGIQLLTVYRYFLLLLHHHHHLRRSQPQHPPVETYQPGRMLLSEMSEANARFDECSRLQCTSPAVVTFGRHQVAALANSANHLDDSECSPCSPNSDAPGDEGTHGVVEESSCSDAATAPEPITLLHVDIQASGTGH